MANGPQDTPDYIRLPQVVPGIVYPPTITPLPNGAVVNLGVFYVGNLPAVICDLRSFLNTQLVRVTYTFCNDDTFLTGTTQYAVLCDNTHFCRSYVPVTGCFVQISMQALGGGAANLSAQLLVNGVGTGMRSNQFANVTDAILGTNAAVGIGANIIVDLPITTPGPWETSMQSSSAAGIVLSVQQQLTNGTWLAVRQRTGAVSALDFPVSLVAAPTRLNLFNTSGVVATFVYALVPTP